MNKKRKEYDYRNSVFSEIEKRISLLDELIAEKEKKISKGPQGSLRAVKHGRGYQYFRRGEGLPDCGEYLRKSKRSIAGELAQKEYDIKILKAAENERKALEYYLTKVSGNDLTDVFSKIPEGKKCLITPVIYDDEEYIRRWESLEYEKKGFPDNYPVYLTNKGERVRSKSEIIIANTLLLMEIPYKYEFPLNINGIEFRPDFTILNVKKRKEMYIEHLGMLSDAEYRENAIGKLNFYESNGIVQGDRLIITRETLKHPLDQNVLKNVLELNLQR